MISIHVVADFAEPQRLDRALTYLVKTKQPSVNIAGGAQLDRAVDFANRVRAALPKTRIEFRILEDTGIIMKLSPVEWYARYVAPRVMWLKEQRIHLVVDNETSGSDEQIREYVGRSIAIADMLHTMSLNGVFCRFATGNIGESQYTFLKALTDKLNSGDVVGPNEYSNRPGQSSGGHLERYKRIEAVAGRTLNISIGEAGILNNYQARHGIATIPMSGKDAAAQMLGEEIWYRGGTIPRHYYCVGGNSDWSSMQPDDGFFEFLEDYYTAHPIGQVEPPVVIPPPKPVPAPTPAPVPAPVPTPAPIPTPTPAPVVGVPVGVLQQVKTALQSEAENVGRIALQLAAVRESITAELQIVDALIEKVTIK